MEAARKGITVVYIFDLLQKYWSPVNRVLHVVSVLSVDQRNIIHGYKRIVHFYHPYLTDETTKFQCTTLIAFQRLLKTVTL